MGRRTICFLKFEINYQMLKVEQKKIGVFREEVNEEKKQPRSKLKCYLLGFGTALSIFGVTIFGTSLPANAKDTCPKPGPVPATPAAPVPAKPSQEIVNTLSGAAAGICALAVTSGSFLVGIVCGVVVAVGILKAQGK